MCYPLVKSSSPTVGMVDGAASEYIAIISGVPQGCVLGPLLFILYTSRMFELFENRLFAFADDSTPTGSYSQASRQTCCCCLPLTGTWLGFRSGAIAIRW